MGEKKVAVLGGGLCGLTLAWQLASKGAKVILLEKNQKLGGLAKTLYWKGFQIEVGPQWFLPREPIVSRELEKIFGQPKEIPSPKIKIWLKKRWVEYPLKIKDLLKFPIFQFLLDIARSWSRDKSFLSNATEIYFELLKPIFSDRFDASLAAVPRPTWYHRPEDPLQSLIKRVPQIFSAPAKYQKTIHDPEKGFQSISEVLKEKIEELGGKVLTNTEVTRVYLPENEVVSIDYLYGGKEYRQNIEFLFSTIPILELLKLFDPLPPHSLVEQCYQLRYYALLLLKIIADTPPEPENWIAYFPEQKYSFYQVSPADPTESAPPDKSCIVVEWLVPLESPLLKASPQQLLTEASAGLRESGLLDPLSFEDYAVHVEKYALPIPVETDPRAMRQIFAYLTKIRRLRSIGQNGAFSPSKLDDIFSASIQESQKIENI